MSVPATDHPVAIVGTDIGGSYLSLLWSGHLHSRKGQDVGTPLRPAPSEQRKIF